MLGLRILAVSAVLALGACSQNDVDITHRVQARLAEEGVTDQVKVTTDRRVVVLDGVVATNAELNRLELAARNTPGVLGIDNRLVVQNPVNLTGGTPEPSSLPGGANPATSPTSPTAPVAP